MNSVALAMDAASAAGVPLRCSPVDYSTDAALTPPEGLEWYANGCRINADTASGVSAVRILNDNIRIRGTLRINLTDIDRKSVVSGKSVSVRCRSRWSLYH